jgi:hypothetical protein
VLTFILVENNSLIVKTQELIFLLEEKVWILNSDLKTLWNSPPVFSIGTPSEILKNNLV